METGREYKNKEGKKVILFGLVLTAVGILGYMGYTKFKEYKERKKEENDPENLPASSTPKIVAPPKSFGFPLKQGSTGEQVKALQQMLINKYGSNILPKYGADGNFGKELSAALKAKGLPDVIDEKTFNMLMNNRKFDASAIARDLHNAALFKNFSQVLSLLQQLKNPGDYSTVSENFKQLRLSGVRQTLVNGLLNSFSGEQKQKIQSEFLRMGLKFDGNKWSLSGTDLPLRIMTSTPTLVWKDMNTAVQVPANFILGYQVAERDGYIVFRNINNAQFLVKSESIKYI